MAKSFNTTSRHAEKAQVYGLFGWFKKLMHRRRVGGISHLSDRMLRDIGLGDSRRSELRKIERLRRP